MHVDRAAFVQDQLRELREDKDIALAVFQAPADQRKLALRPGV